MRALKMIIIGQLLAVVTAYYPHQDVLSEEERRDFIDLKKCVDILQHKKQEVIIHKLTHDPNLIEL